MNLACRGLYYLAVGALAANLALSACSPAPRTCEDNLPFLSLHSYQIREHVVTLAPTYDVVSGDNCKVGTITRDLATLTRNTKIEVYGARIGSINTKIVSLGHDMSIYDADGNVINTADHKLLNSLMNFGGFYIEIKDPAGSLVATLKQDPFALWTQAKWRYFEVRDADGKSIASIQYIRPVPDTYEVANTAKKLDNRTLAGIVGILDQLEDKINDSDSKNSGRK